MFLSVILMLILLGVLRRRDGKDGRPYFRTALGLGGVCIALLTGIALAAEGGEAWMFEIFTACWIVPVLLIVWGAIFLRDGWILRTGLILWIAGCFALMAWARSDRSARQEELERTNANLLRCGELVKAGKRAELRAFFDRNDIGGGRDGWNAAFEAAFPPAGGRK